MPVAYYDYDQVLRNVPTVISWNGNSNYFQEQSRTPNPEQHYWFWTNRDGHRAQIYSHTMPIARARQAGATPPLNDVEPDPRMSRSEVREWLFDMIVMELQMPAQLPNHIPEDEDESKRAPHERMPVYKTDRGHRWNLNVRIRPGSSFEDQPSYATVSVYRAYKVMDAEGNKIEEGHPDYETVWVEFGPSEMTRLKKISDDDPNAEMDILIPTRDPAISIYAGRLVQRACPTYRHNWKWDMEVSHDLKALVHGRPVEDLMPLPDPDSPEFERLEEEMRADPLVAVLRRGT